jgi:hypothetical protein
VNGVLRITGDYRATETSELLFDVAAETFDQLIVQGNATLAGTLTIDALNYEAMPGDAFPLATFGSSDGEFSTQTLAGSGVGLSIEPSGVTLIVASDSVRIRVFGRMNVITSTWMDHRRWQNLYQPVHRILILLKNWILQYGCERHAMPFLGRPILSK